MLNKQCLLSKEVELVVEGKGRTKKDALADIFTRLRKQIYNEIDGLILHMQPEEVYILSEEVERTKEAFLGVFMKRVKEQYELKAKITVSLKYIEVE